MKFIVDCLPLTKNRCPFSEMQNNGDNIYYECKLDGYPCNLMFDNAYRGCRWIKEQKEFYV